MKENKKSLSIKATLRTQKGFRGEEICILLVLVLGFVWKRLRNVLLLVFCGLVITVCPATSHHQGCEECNKESFWHRLSFNLVLSFWVPLLVWKHKCVSVFKCFANSKISWCFEYDLIFYGVVFFLAELSLHFICNSTCLNRLLCQSTEWLFKSGCTADEKKHRRLQFAGR